MYNGHKILVERFSELNLADLETAIDTFLANGYVMIDIKINQLCTEALLTYYNNYDNYFANGILSFGLDGSGIRIYDNFYPAVLNTGIEATTFSVTNLINTAGCYSWVQLNNMMVDGIENQCHTFDHTRLTTLTFAQIQANLTNANNMYIANGFPVPEHIAYPFGSFNDTVKSACATMRLTGRTIEPYVMYPQFRTVDKFEITAVYGDLQTYPEHKINVIHAIDQAVINKSLLTWYDHGFTDQSDYEEIINYALSRGITIMKYSDIFPLLLS